MRKLQNSYNQWQNIRPKVKNHAKLGKARKLWYLLFWKFWPLLATISFCRGNWRACASTQFQDFLFISSFPHFLRLKSIGNSLGKSFKKFIILDIKFCFTCGKLNLHRKYSELQKYNWHVRYLWQCSDIRDHKHCMNAWFNQPLRADYDLNLIWVHIS